MDEVMARHFAHLYIRDPLTLFSEKIHLNDKEDSDHFEVNETYHCIYIRYVLPDLLLLNVSINCLKF